MDVLAQLDDSIHQQILVLSARGNKLFESERYDAARQEFDSAWKRLPEPRYEWEAATWLLASIGDCWFHVGNYQAAHDCFQEILRNECSESRGNVFIHLRRGQTALELGHESLAANDLISAYMLGGCEAFDEDDPKYFLWLRENVVEPKGGWFANIG